MKNLFFVICKHKNSPEAGYLWNRINSMQLTVWNWGIQLGVGDMKTFTKTAATVWWDWWSLLPKSGGGVHDSTKCVFIIIPCAKYQTDMNNAGLTTKVQFMKFLHASRNAAGLPCRIQAAQQPVNYVYEEIIASRNCLTHMTTSSSSSSSLWSSHDCFAALGLDHENE